MDFNKFHHSSSSPNMHNFMPISALLFPYTPTPEECFEEGKDYEIEALNHQLKAFWDQQMLDIYNTSDLKSSHQLPLARIKRIMKLDGAVKMISADAPIMFSKACELLIMELSFRAWLHTEASKRRTLQSCDIVRAIAIDPIFGFLRHSPLYNRHLDNSKEDGNSSHVEEASAVQITNPPNDVVRDS